MANFPGSVYAPSAVSNGQTIDASRDNGQDAEITAIEQGYLQGSAPLNSSNSTVANLSVAGGSTLGNAVASSLTVSAGSSFAVRPVMPPPEMALVSLQSTVTIGSSAGSTVAWTLDTYLSNASMHSTASNPERLIPQTTGMYLFTAQVSMTGAPPGIRQLAISDSSNVTFGVTRVFESTGIAVTLQASGYKRFDITGGYAVAWLALTGNSTISLTTGGTQAFFSMQKL